MAGRRTNSAWPRTEDGRTDWEAVFEHPDTGFIALVTQAKTPAALRKSTVFIIQALYAEGDAPKSVRGFEAELGAMLPDDLPPAALPKVATAVEAILRQIKDERVRRDESDGDRVEKPAGASSSSRKPGGRRKPPREKWVPAQIIAAVFALVVLIGAGAGGFYYYFVMDPGDLPGARAKQLIAEMEQASVGAGPDHHVFGWPLTVDRRAGLIGVTAAGVPNDVCASVAWYFVNRGNVVINDRMPEKAGPMVLKRFCDEKGQTAKLLWLSKDPAAQNAEGQDAAAQ